jgi:hypothetical protein
VLPIVPVIDNELAELLGPDPEPVAPIASNDAIDPPPPEPDVSPDPPMTPLARDLLEKLRGRRMTDDVTEDSRVRIPSGVRVVP